MGTEYMDRPNIGSISGRICRPGSRLEMDDLGVGVGKWTNAALRVLLSPGNERFKHPLS